MSDKKVVIPPDDFTPVEYDPQYILMVNKLRKYFPIKGGMVSRTVGYVKAVDGITFNIRRGTTMGLVGESGCGKTTVGRTILRLSGDKTGQRLTGNSDTVRRQNNGLRLEHHGVRRVKSGEIECETAARKDEMGREERMLRIEADLLSGTDRQRLHLARKARAFDLAGRNNDLPREPRHAARQHKRALAELGQRAGTGKRAVERDRFPFCDLDSSALFARNDARGISLVGDKKPAVRGERGIRLEDDDTSTQTHPVRHRQKRRRRHGLGVQEVNRCMSEQVECAGEVRIVA